MKLKRILLSLILVATLPFAMKVSAKGKFGLLTTKDCISTANPKDTISFSEINTKLCNDFQDCNLLIKFNEENKTPQITNAIYLQIFSKLITNVFIDNIKENYNLDLDEFKIKDYEKVDLNNVLFAFNSSLALGNNQQSIPEIFKKLVNSKDWNFYIAKNITKNLGQEKFNILGRYVGYILETGLDCVYNKQFKPKIEKYINEGALDKILNGIISRYNELKNKPEFKENSELFKEKHPEYPEGFIEEINRIKNLNKEEQKKYFGEILYKMSFNFKQA